MNMLADHVSLRVVQQYFLARPQRKPQLVDRSTIGRLLDHGREPGVCKRQRFRPQKDTDRP